MRSSGSTLRGGALVAAYVLPILLVWNGSWGDIEHYFAWANRLAAGQVPYRDMTFEYPPLAVIVVGLPRLVGHSLAAYGVAFMGQMWVFDALQKWALQSVVRPERRLLAVWAHTVGGGVLYFTYLKRFDVAVVACLTVALVRLWQRPDSWVPWFAWAAGVCLKLFPVFVAPAMLLAMWRRGVPRLTILARCGGGIAAVAACVGTSVALCGPAALSWVAYHHDRGMQITSVYAAAWLLVRGFGGPIPSEFNFGALHLTDPAMRAWQAWSTPMMAIALALSYALFSTRLRTSTSLWRLVLACLLAVLATSKVFSPQFAAWIVPFCVLAAVTPRRVDWPLLMGMVAAAALTAELYPGEWSMRAGQVHKQVALVLRASVVLVLWGYVMLRASSGDDTLSERQAPRGLPAM